MAVAGVEQEEETPKGEEEGYIEFGEAYLFAI